MDGGRATEGGGILMYKLDKPYTDEEKLNFIVTHNYDNGRRIEETETCLYALEDNEIMQDGVPIVNPDWDSIQLAQAKQDKIALNDELRDTALLRGVTYNNVLFDSDTDQKANIMGCVFTMSDEDTITWWGMDNQGLLCTKADLIAIGGLITELHSFCWGMNAYIKEQIQTAQTVEEIEAIEISYVRDDS